MPASDLILLFALMSAPALFGGCFLFGIYLWFRYWEAGFRKKALLFISQVILFYLCSFIILVFDRETILSAVIRPILETVGLDGFPSFFFAGQLLALFVSVLLLEIFRKLKSFIT